MATLSSNNTEGCAARETGEPPLPRVLKRCVPKKVHKAVLETFQMDTCASAGNVVEGDKAMSYFPFFFAFSILSRFFAVCSVRSSLFSTIMFFFCVYFFCYFCYVFPCLICCSLSSPG